MRCKTCGWVNPENQTRCEKCKTPLSFQAENAVAEGIALNNTVEGCPECGFPLKRPEKSCPQCGHVFEKRAQVADNKLPVIEIADKAEEKRNPAPIAVNSPVAVKKICPLCKSNVPETALYCSNCGASMGKERKNKEGTVTPFLDNEQVSAPECSLTLIARENEAGNQSPLHFTGNVVRLNRNNTEPNNNTITSKEQAELTFENNKWYILDKSALKTTYLYIGEKTALKPGDIIVLGNRLFEFNPIKGNQT
ncbi:MAG: zinc ribbon domain-containing protein [Tannerella sp.]|jgi:predicted nucleic acid-binding Zn ribbon protein|nr:zinc ribbon domain-containing protein [Tannerella sp.]